MLTLNLWYENSRSGPGKSSEEAGVGGWTERCRSLQLWLKLLQPDIVCLQEVLQGNGHDMLADIFGQGDDESSGKVNQAPEFPYRFYARASSWWLDPQVDFGNAIVSRFPLTRTKALELPVQLTPKSIFYETRGAALAHVETPHGSVIVSSLHLNHQLHHTAIRLAQTRHVVKAMRDFAKETNEGKVLTKVICGDFNAKPDEACIRFIRGANPIAEPENEDVFYQDAWAFCHGDQAPGYTWSSKNPGTHVDLEENKRLDYVFVSPPHRDGRSLVEDCRIVCDHPFAGDFPSDHFGVLTEIRMHSSIDTPRGKL